jgi:hypothetical protein
MALDSYFVIKNVSTGYFMRRLFLPQDSYFYAMGFLIRWTFYTVPLNQNMSGSSPKCWRLASSYGNAGVWH